MGEPGHELVMPFVVCKSQGGPYEDDAFVAGYRLGIIDKTLQTTASWRGPVRATDMAQLDLIAMRYEREIVTRLEAGDWVVVEIGRPL